VKVPTSLIEDRDLSDAAHRLREKIAAKSWKTGTAKLSMPDLIEMTGWSESKIRRARQELYDKRLLHFGKWKERRGPAVGSIYRLLDPGDPEPDEAAEQEGNPPSATDHPVTGDTPPCHQQQPLYEEGYEDLRDLDVSLSGDPREETGAPVEARTDRRPASPEAAQKLDRWRDVLEVLETTERWVPSRARTIALLDELAGGERTKFVNLLAMARRFKRELPDHPGWGRGRGGVQESFRRHVVDCPDDQQAWLLAPGDDPTHGEACEAGEECSACGELLYRYDVAMRPALRDWTEDEWVRQEWEGLTRAADVEQAAECDGQMALTGSGFAEYVRVKREVLG
jgi:hypothetical protein